MDERPHWKTEEEFAMTTRPTVEGVSEAPVIRFTSAAVGGLQPTMWVLASCHDALRQQLAEMRANDVRYRHIRSEECGLTLKHDLLFGEDLDAQLDAEIARLPASTSQPAETQRLAAEALQRQFTGDVAAAGADFIANCPLGASQPSRGKCVCECEMCFGTDCAQPERQGADTALRDAYTALVGVNATMAREIKRLNETILGIAKVKLIHIRGQDERPSPPTDDIVAGLRKVLAMPAHSAFVHVAFEACEKAIAALGEKGSPAVAGITQQEEKAIREALHYLEKSAEGKYADDISFIAMYSRLVRGVLERLRPAEKPAPPVAGGR